MSTYYGLYTFGSTPYREYLQTKSFVEDITGSTQQLRMTVSKESRAMIANAEQLSGRQIEVLNSVANEVGNLGPELREGFETICYGLKEVSQGVEYLEATFHWGFTEMLTEFRRVNASLEELVRLVKNPAQTWAYEQFETARDAARQSLYPEAVEALERAINGFGAHTGYKLEYRFHYYLGKFYLGDAQNTDPAILSLEKAESTFATAARYAKTDFPKEASLAVMAAGWAAYCQGKLSEAANYTKQAIHLDGENAEAHFQLGKIHMHLGAVNEGIKCLGDAIKIDRHYSLKAAADGDYQKNDVHLNQFLGELRTGAIAIAKQRVDSAEESLRQMKEWHSHERSPKECTKAEQLLQSAKQFLLSNTYYAGLDAEHAALEAGVTAEMALRNQRSGLNDSIELLFESMNREFYQIAAAAKEHAPLAFLVVDKLVCEALSKKAASLESYARAQEDLKRIQSAKQALEGVSQTVAQRTQKIQEVESYNSRRIPNHWAFGCLGGFVWFVVFSVLIVVYYGARGGEYPFFIGILQLPAALVLGFLSPWLIIRLIKLVTRRQPPPKS